MSTFQFDANKFAAVAGAAVVPPGQYQTQVVDVLEKRARSGDGTYVQIALRIAHGDHEGRIVWVRLHMGSRHEHVRAIAQQELAAMLLAMAVPKINSWDDVIGRCVVVTVGLKRRDGGDLTNVVRSYASCASPITRPSSARSPRR
jgi:hypothetical protein